MVSLVIKEMARHGPSHRALLNWYSTAYESFNWLDWSAKDARDVFFLTTAVHTTHARNHHDDCVRSGGSQARPDLAMPQHARCALLCRSLERQLRQTSLLQQLNDNDKCARARKGKTLGTSLIFFKAQSSLRGQVSAEREQSDTNSCRTRAR